MRLSWTQLPQIECRLGLENTPLHRGECEVLKLLLECLPVTVRPWMRATLHLAHESLGNGVQWAKRQHGICLRSPEPSTLDISYRADVIIFYFPS